MSPPDLSGTTALVTGASSGIGEAMARLLASWRCDLVLTARRADRLEALASELRAHSIRCRCLPEDLADPRGPERLHRRVREGGAIDILVNNAGSGRYEPFEATSWEHHAALLQLNVTSLVELTHRFLPDLRARPRAHVLNVASVAAWMALPHFAGYGASKAYVLSFSQALAAELDGTAVRVTCLCPGGTVTEFPQASGQTLGRAARAGMMSAERCAAVGLRGMLRGQRVVVPGASNKLTRAATWLLPRRLVAAAAGRFLGPPAHESPALSGDAERRPRP